MPSSRNIFFVGAESERQHRSQNTPPERQPWWWSSRSWQLFSCLGMTGSAKWFRVDGSFRLAIRLCGFNENYFCSTDTSRTQHAQPCAGYKMGKQNEIMQNNLQLELFRRATSKSKIRSQSTKISRNCHTFLLLDSKRRPSDTSVRRRTRSHSLFLFHFKPVTKKLHQLLQFVLLHLQRSHRFF